jgi:hypothetical protein
MWTRRRKPDLSPDEMRILREHWEWSGNYALLWIIGTIVIFGGIFVLLDFFEAEDRVRLPSLIMLATLTVVNAIWRAAGVHVADRFDALCPAEKPPSRCEQGVADSIGERSGSDLTSVQ